MHQRFEQMLELLEKQFDTLIVDAPPIFAVSDAAIIGRMTGATLMVAGRGAIRSQNSNNQLNDSIMLVSK